MGYFTEQEIREIRTAMKDVSNVGIDIKTYDACIPSIEQQKEFFDKAKLWQVIKRIISVLYIKRLSKGEMFLQNGDGNKYRVIKMENK